jgi:hypothetical protein
MLRCKIERLLVIWDDIVQQGCSSWGYKTLKCLLYQLVFGYVVYNLWQTRNELIHAALLSTEEQLLKKILWEVRTRIVGKWKVPRIRENLILCSLWNLLADMLL